MSEALRVLGDGGVLIFVVATMMGLGFRLTVNQIVGPLRSPRLPLTALLANFVFVPALALAIRASLPLDEAVGIGLILMGTAAGAPFLPPVVQAAKGDVGASVGVLILLMGVTIIYLPLALPLLLPGTRIDPFDIVSTLIAFMLVPLVIGLLVHRRSPTIARRWQAITSRVANIGLIVGILALLILHWRALFGVVGTGAITVSIVLIAGAFAIGWLVAGFDRASQPVLALATGLRNIPAAFVTADLNFEDRDVLVTCIVVALVTLLGVPLLARVLARHAPASVSADKPR